MVPVDDSFDISLQKTVESISKLGNNRACGPDELHALLLKAGGTALAVKVNDIERRAVQEERIPTRWKGGRLVDLSKKKGDPAECSSSRGLFVSDHFAKCFIGKLRDEIKPTIKDFTPEDQFGGCEGGGTDYRAHVVRSLIEYAAMAQMSILVLFVDLVSAYDSVVREIVLGFPHDLPFAQQRSYLRKLDLPEEVVSVIMTYLQEHGPLFRPLGCDDKVLRLMNALHTKAWACYGDLPSVIISRRGGRQGCILGGTIFNGVYSVAMKEVRLRLREKGIAFNAKLPVD